MKLDRGTFIFLALVTMVGIFVLDVRAPRVVAVGTLYIIPVFISLGLRDKRFVIGAGAASLVVLWMAYLVGTPLTGVPTWISLINCGIGSLAVIASTWAVTHRLEAERMLYERIRRQQAVALFGRHALTMERIDDLMKEACRILAEFFQVKYCKILEYRPTEKRVVMINGFGWRPDDMGWSESTEGDTFTAYTFRHNHEDPLVVADLPREKRFKPTELLVERGIESCVNVLVPGKEHPYGILEVDTPRPNYFKKEDAYVLQLMANILGDAIERCRAEATLRRSNQGLEEFASVASHDLQEPLRKIFTFSERVVPLVSTDEGRQYIEKTRSAANRMKSLIDDLLLFSRLKVGEQGARRPIDMNELIHEVIDALELRIQEKQAVVNIQAGLPRVQGNYFQIQQLFTNLVSNALKYIPGGKVPVIRVKCETKDGMAEFTVRDNGIGFDEKYAEEIFRPFKRLHGKGQFEGTGMGLTISKRVVEQHGGRIWARGAPDEGATFFVTLPLAQ